MANHISPEFSLGEVHNSVDTDKHAKGWRKVFSFLGPAYLISVGYMDPGNWATDIEGGSKFGYKLIWVLLMSNIMALLLQNLSARLGIVRGRDLAQANRETYPSRINFILYILAELAIAACDLAEVLGMAIGIHLLTGLPLIWGVCLTVTDTLLLLYLQKLGMRKMEAFIVALVVIIGVSFLIELWFAKPPLGEVMRGFVPSLPGEGALYIAIGIIGATVMPHNLYLHSALVQTRKIKRDDAGIRKSLKMNLLDTGIALNLAFFVNAAILVLAGKVFFEAGKTNIASIQDAHQMLAPLLGTKLAPILFAVALIAAGQSSTVTGTLAGQIVMEGYLRLRINPWLRRLLTRVIAIAPAAIVIAVYGDEKVDELLVFSQVLLSMQLGFAVIPLIHFVSEKEKMGKFVIGPWVKVAAWTVAALLIYLNLQLIFTETVEFLQNNHPMWSKALAVSGVVLLIVLLLIVTLFPWIRKKQLETSIEMHPQKIPLRKMAIPSFKRVAVALDFSRDDGKLIAYAMGQGNETTSYVLIHIVESASAKILGEVSGDYESFQDEQQLNQYVEQLRLLGAEAVAKLGFRNRHQEIARIVREEHADLLIMGAHGHTGVKDWLYGETINQVRHEIKIPVLVVNL